MVKPVWADFVSGSLTATLPAINAGSTQTMTSDGLLRMPSVVIGVTQAKVTIDPFASQGDPELLYVISHAAGTNTAIVQRVTGQPLRQHLASEQWVHGPTAEDFNEFQLQLDNQLHTSVFTAQGQLLGASAPNTPAAVDQGAQFQALTTDTSTPTHMRWLNIPFPSTAITHPTLAQGAYEGMIIYEVDTDHLLVNVDPTANGGAGQWHYIDDPPGMIAPYAGSAVPTGWRWCDGAQYDGSLPMYIPLFTAIGQQFGGTGSLFNVPDLRGRHIYGWDPALSGAANVVNARGYVEGSDNLTLQQSHLPAHTHAIASHNHAISHHHTMEGGLHDLADLSPYPIMAYRKDGQPQNLIFGATQPGANNGIAVTFSSMDNSLLGPNGSFSGGSGALTTDNGPGSGAAANFTPRRMRLGFMIRR